MWDVVNRYLGDASRDVEDEDEEDDGDGVEKSQVRLKTARSLILYTR